MKNDLVVTEYLTKIRNLIDPMSEAYRDGREHQTFLRAKEVEELAGNLCQRLNDLKWRLK